MESSDPYLRQRYSGQSALYGGSVQQFQPQIAANDLIAEVLKPAPKKLIENTPGSSVSMQPSETPAVIEKAIPVRSPQEAAEFYGIGQQPQLQSAQQPVQQEQAQQPAQQAQPQVQQQPASQKPAFKTFQNIISYNPQTGDEYDFKRKILSDIRKSELLNYQRKLLSSTNDPGVAKQYLDLAKNTLDMQGIVDLPEYDKTEEFKTVKEKFTAATEADSTLTRKFGEAIKSAEEALARGDRSTAFSIMESQLPKQIQSISTGSPDAIQGPEFTRIALALKSVFNTSPTEVLDLINKKGFADAFKSQPEKFLDFAKVVHDANVNVLDQKREFAESILGKRYARGVIGSIAGQQRFNALESKDADPKRQQIYTIINNPNLSKETRDAARAKLTQLYGGQ